jgi:murein DD-endopeptidase MepM/ murein hydrolase activator NlpD
VSAEKPSAVWPLDLPPILTSTFGESRPNRLHAGIDLGTNGRIGVRCFAVGDGCVARLRMSPFGYGKAIYVQLDSGPIVVYAHLSRFASPLAERARREQLARRAYTFDVDLPAGELRVARGQLLAWSGQTGVGVPHLHFEMRDGDVARNPQTAGFAVPDALPPTIEDVTVLPMDSSARVQGSLAPTVVPWKTGRGTSPVVHVEGRVGFSVRAWDAAVAGPWRQAPYRYDLRVDGKTLFRAVHERFDYADNHLIVLEYDQERLVDRGEEAFLLFDKPGNRLPGREVAPEGVAIAAGDHEVRIEVADVAGNFAEAHFRIRAAPAPRVTDLGGEAVTGRSGTFSGTAVGDDSLDVDVETTADRGVTWRPSAITSLRSGPEVHFQGALPSLGTLPVVVRARVRDASGLASVRTWSTGAGTPSAAPLPLEVHARWHAEWLAVEIAAQSLLAVPPRLWVVQPGGRRAALGVEQVDSRRYLATCPLQGGLGRAVDSLEVEAQGVDGRRARLRQPLRARIARRGEALRIADLDPNLVLEVPEGALFEDAAFRVVPQSVRGVSLGTELRPAGPCLRVEPRSLALDKPVRVGLRPARAGGARRSLHLGLFAMNREGQLRFLSADRDSSGGLVGATRVLGTFAVLSDETPPRIGPVRVEAAGPKGARLRFTVLDHGADLGDGGIQVQLDGGFAIPEWDPETGDVRVETSGPLGRGIHRLHVRAADRVGNVAERVASFTIP